MEELNERYVDWENQSPKIFQSKFLYACLLVFGMSLFNVSAQEEMMLGQIVVTKIENPAPTDSLNKKTSDKKATAKIVDEDRDYKKGKIAYQPEEEIELDEKHENLYIKGEIAYIPDTSVEENITTCEVVPEDTTVSSENNSVEELNDPVNNSTEPENTEPEEIESSDFIIGVYPNPTSFEGTVSLKIFKADNYTVDLVDLNGRIIFQIHTGFLREGENFFQLDVNEIPDGTYLIQAISDSGSKAIKMVKAGAH